MGPGYSLPGPHAAVSEGPHAAQHQQFRALPGHGCHAAAAWCALSCYTDKLGDVLMAIIAENGSASGDAAESKRMLNLLITTYDSAACAGI